MVVSSYTDEEQMNPSVQETLDRGRPSLDSVTSASTTSIALERINLAAETTGSKYHPGTDEFYPKEESYDEELNFLPKGDSRPVEKKTQRVLWSLGALCLGGWLLAFILFASLQSYKHPSSMPHNPAATVSKGSGKPVTLDQVLQGQWRGREHQITWIKGAQGEDGLLVEKEGGSGRDYLVVEDVRSSKSDGKYLDSVTLMKQGAFKVGKDQVYPSKVWPSQDLKKVLVMSSQQHNWRYSYTGYYWIFDVATQQAQALDPGKPDDRIQLATWSPQSDAIVFTRGNNMFLRKLSSNEVIQITQDGGDELFYGVPDWVYEEEVFQDNSATWWSEDGNYIAFLRSNDSAVPEYPIQYFVSRPSGQHPPPGQENYPEVRQIKYPKAGAPNPVVDLQFYDVSKKEVFKVETDSDIPDESRLITEVIWAGKDGKVLVRETNRESDILKVVLINVQDRSGKVVRTLDVTALDGGWFEVSEETRFIPSDPANGRPHGGYVDTVIHDGYDHLAYFTPLDNPDPIHLTNGKWEVVKAPSAIDLKNNLVYFIATKESSIQRHVYSVKLDGTELQPITDTSKEGYFDVSFSTGVGYALLTYKGPDIPWQKVISTPSNSDNFENHIEDNQAIAKLAAETEIPIEIYQTVRLGGFDLNVVERRPPHFNENKMYPVIFYLYGGPMSQTVDKKFNVDFQSYMASSLGYIVVTVDGRGTGFLGREARCIIRGHIGYFEAQDQIDTAKIWAQKKYVDADRMAIWGWSYGGFMTLKTLELDGGNTFKYGMAVAPVTDWGYYDSVYTERYMHTPQHNPDGYKNTSITNVQSMQKNIRFLIMHGVADDNVHMQNSLTLLDKFDLAGVENYDFHAFPDSDHSIYFHNANKIVYDRLSNWIINAFNGEWLRTENPIPCPLILPSCHLVVRIQRFITTLSAKKSLFSTGLISEGFSALPVFFAPSIEMATFFQSVRQGFNRQNKTNGNGNNQGQQKAPTSQNSSPTAYTPPAPPPVTSMSSASTPASSQETPSNGNSQHQLAQQTQPQMEPESVKFFFREKYARLGVKGNFMPLAAQPKNVDLGEWLAHQAVEQYRIVEALILCIQEVDAYTGLAICNPKCCPVMSAGKSHTYTWLNNDKVPIKVPACQYISLVQRWIVGKIHDPKAFPTDNPSGSPANTASTYASGGINTPGSNTPIPAGPTNLSTPLSTLSGTTTRDWLGKSAGFPESFFADCKTSFRQIFRLYAHLYHSHWIDPFWHMTNGTNSNGWTDLNSCFVHYISVAKLFGLLSDKDMEPMQPLIDLWIQNGSIPEDAARGACTIVS